MSWLGKLRAVAAGVTVAGNSSGSRTIQRRHTPLTDVVGITGDDFRNDTFLQKWCDRCVHIAVEEVGRPCWSHHLMQHVASLCTGSAMDHAILDNVGASLRSERIAVDFQVDFTCEMARGKTRWIQ